MGAAEQYELLSVAEYLAREERAETKSEYLNGVVYAMAGGKGRHSQIAANALGILHAQLRGKPCRPFNSDMKLRVRLPEQTRFYYPDAMIVCPPIDPDKTYLDTPSVILEVLSSSTRRTDEGEKKDAYLTIPSLTHYLLAEPEAPVVTVFERGEPGFTRTVLQGLDSMVNFPELEAKLPLGELYEGLEF
ncbi:MAG: Uma2 family endonuclease [Verrucomicrobiota bacterium]